MLDPLLLMSSRIEVPGEVLNRRFAHEYAELQRIDRLERRLKRARARYRLVRETA